jgi:hypothetical protein
MRDAIEENIPIHFAATRTASYPLPLDGVKTTFKEFSMTIFCQ